MVCSGRTRSDEGPRRPAIGPALAPRLRVDRRCRGRSYREGGPNQWRCTRALAVRCRPPGRGGRRGSAVESLARSSGRSGPVRSRWKTRQRWREWSGSSGPSAMPFLNPRIALRCRRRWHTDPAGMAGAPGMSRPAPLPLGKFAIPRSLAAHSGSHTIGDPMSDRAGDAPGGIGRAAGGPSSDRSASGDRAPRKDLMKSPFREPRGGGLYDPAARGARNSLSSLS
jgi:hypothetical protein